MRADWIKLMMAAARSPQPAYRCAAIQQITSSSARVPMAVSGSRPVVVDGHSPIVQVARQHYPAFQAVI